MTIKMTMSISITMTVTYPNRVFLKKGMFFLFTSANLSNIPPNNTKQSKARNNKEETKNENDETSLSKRDRGNKLANKFEKIKTRK